MYHEILGSPFAADWEIVLVDAEGGDKAKEFYAEFNQPWLALPFDNKGKLEGSVDRFGLISMPTVIRLNGRTGKPLDSPMQVGDTVTAFYHIGEDDPLRQNVRGDIDHLYLPASVVSTNEDGKFTIEWSDMIPDVGGTTDDKSREEIRKNINAWQEMQEASSARDLLEKWNATPYPDGPCDDGKVTEVAFDVAFMFELADKWCPAWWPRELTDAVEHTENPDVILSFESVCLHAAVIWLSPLFISAVATPFVRCDSGGPTWAYLLTLCPGAWAAYHEIKILKQMAKFRYEKTVQGGWFMNSFDFHTKLKERQFFTYDVLPVKGPFGSMVVLLAFSFLDWFDVMAKWFFVVSSHQCQSWYHIDESFAQSFKPVPIIGTFAVWFVELCGVSGIALIFYVVFIMGCQGFRGFWMLYQMSNRNQRYKRSITDLAKASGFASMRVIERMLSDVALEQELRLKDRLDGECHKNEEWTEYRGAAPETESAEELEEMRAHIKKVIDDFFWNLVFIFGVRILGENMMSADLQASYVGLMWSDLEVKGIAVAVLSVIISATCSIYKLVMIIYLLPRDSKETNNLRNMSYCMLAVLLCLTLHIFAKICAAFWCPYHLFNLSQMGCYRPA